MADSQNQAGQDPHGAGWPLAAALLAALAQASLLAAAEPVGPVTNAAAAAKPPPAPDAAAKELVIDLGNGEKLELVRIEPGEFVMAKRRDKQPELQHRVAITRPFYLAKYEVTQGQWLQATGKRHKTSNWWYQPRLPINCVLPPDWEEFCETLNQKFGKHLPAGMVFRLPTEAEWEYACRAGTETDFWFGDDPAKIADCEWVACGKPREVGTKQPNPWGLYDMHGNVMECCLDQAGGFNFTPGETLKDPYVPYPPGRGDLCIMRGGGWRYPAVPNALSAFRRPYAGLHRDIGFRVAAGPELKK
jgi:formylglycine-generating enzyme required for sulfatase activity